MSVWKSNEKLVIFASLNFIRLLRVVSSSRQRRYRGINNYSK